jgi:ATPase
MASFGDHPLLPDSLESILVDESVSTIFLKAECKPRVKSGHISSLSLNELDLEVWDKPNLLTLSEDLSLIIEQNPNRSDCFIEIEREGCKVMQIGDLRVSCAWPPFSDAWEITVVRPVANLQLSDYKLDDELVNRLSNHHRGVFVVGKPGSGKTTFAQAIASYLDSEMGAMVKTMESPRDLQVPQRVTQYAPLEGDLEKTAEIIFLLRPDFVIFDEVRRARDFEIFGDVRLAGVGLLGVTHANSGLQAIQRLVGKVELGLISQVLDTVIHIEKGRINQVLELKMVVRAPSGMESDLSRPVIEIREFPSNRLTHEMFAFGSEIAVVPVDGVRSNNGVSPVAALARDQLIKKIRDWVGVSCGVKITGTNSAEIYAPKGVVSTLIGKGGENIRDLQDELGGMKLSVASFGEMPDDVHVPVEDHHETLERRARESKAWEYSKRGRKSKKRRR